MKLQINSTEKIIRIEEKVNLGELFTFLEEILPDMKWREYTLEGTIINNWTYPIITTPYQPYSPSVLDPNYPWITYTIDVNSNIT